MQKKRPYRFCLWITLIAAVIAGCVILSTLGAIYWFGSEVMPEILATPTEINTCEGLLDFMVENYESTGSTREISPTSPQVLVVYPVNGDQIGEPDFKTVSQELQSLQQETNSHHLIWAYFTQIIPTEQRELLSEYRIITDGLQGEIAAQVEIGPQYTSEGDSDIWVLESEQWVLLVDLADYSDNKLFTSKLLHEFGHLLTLNAHQVYYAVEDPANCSRFFANPGCSMPGSYLLLFFERYWGDLYGEWQTITSQDDASMVKSSLDTFYEAHQAEFLTRYAVTAPTEDIAEAWSLFVLSPKPDGDTIAEQKILFFYNFPEFVQLRAEITRRICEYFHLSSSLER